MTWNNPVNWTDPSGLAGEGASYARISAVTGAAIRYSLLFARAGGGAVYSRITAIAALSAEAGGAVQGWLLAGLAATVQWSNLHMRGLAGDLTGYSYNGDPYGIVPVYNTPANGGTGSGAETGAGAGQGASAGAGAPSPNNGNCKPHGKGEHWKLIQALVSELKGTSGVSDIRVNQRQVDINGNVVGRNRPDVQ